MRTFTFGLTRAVWGMFEDERGPCEALCAGALTLVALPLDIVFLVPAVVLDICVPGCLLCCLSMSS